MSANDKESVTKLFSELAILHKQMAKVYEYLAVYFENDEDDDDDEED